MSDLKVTLICALVVGTANLALIGMVYYMSNTLIATY